MNRQPNSRKLPFGRLLVLLAIVAALAVTFAVVVGASASTAPKPSATISVSNATVGPPVAAGFVGLATEYWNVERETGTNPKQPDVPFEQALKALAPEGGFSLRIGGDSTDWTWWPIAGTKTPPWVRFTITPTWNAVTDRLVDDLHAHVILGINMEADSVPVASAEIKELQSVLGTAPLTFELGNEPELYSHFPFYHDAHGAVVLGRPKTFSLTNMTTQWGQLADALPAVRWAGPGYAGLDSLPYVGQFLSADHKLSLLTVHTYPLKSTRCAAQRPQVSSLFTPASLQTLASGVAQWVSVARQHGVGVRVDEMNSITCGGQPGVTNAFGPALWALNILPLYAEDGVNGVNIQSRPQTAQNLIQTNQLSSGRWQIVVQPEYYGLLAFAQLTPPGSRMLQVGAMPTGLYAWADQTPQGQRHVVITNVGSTATTLAVPAGRGAASVQTLSGGAGGLQATGGITLGGQHVSEATGQLSGSTVAKSVSSTSGDYDVTVAPDSAAIVTFKS